VGQVQQLQAKLSSEASGSTSLIDPWVIGQGQAAEFSPSSEADVSASLDP